MELTKILLLVSQSIFATGVNGGLESTHSPGIIKLSQNSGASFILEDISKFLGHRHGLFSTNRGLDGWSRMLVFKKVKNGERLDRLESLKVVSSLTAEIEEHFSNLFIYPITLNFNQDDVPALEKLDVSDFISRVQTVVFDGPKRRVIEAKHSELSGSTDGYWNSEWYYAMSNPSIWFWEEPTSVREILESDIVTAVKRLSLGTHTAYLTVEQSRSVIRGDIEWVVTKTYRLYEVERDGIPAEEILLNAKFKSIQDLKLEEESDHSVMVNTSVLANLENLTSLGLSGSTNPELVELSALAKLKNLKYLNLPKNSKDVSVLTNQLPNLVVRYSEN